MTFDTNYLQVENSAMSSRQLPFSSEYLAPAPAKPLAIGFSRSAQDR